MRVGIKKNVDLNTAKSLESFYDIVRTPDFDEGSRLLIPKHGTKIIGCSKNKICRFCGKGEGEVTFKKIAHAFPQSIGNSALASNYECDDCNQFFGNTIENEYANFFSLYHSIMKVNGKNGIPKCSFKIPCSMRTNKCAKNCVDIDFKDNIPYIRKCREVDSQYVNCTSDSIIISKPVGNHCPIAVFKAIIKMAITVMPIEEISIFSDTIKWILNPEQSNLYADKKLLVRYKMIPGFNVIEYPCYKLFKRKTTVWKKPYMLFNLTYGCFSLFVEIPRKSDECPNSEFIRVPFPEIPFYTSTEGTWDLSKQEGDKNLKHSITLSFDNITECTEDVEISQENRVRFKSEL